MELEASECDVARPGQRGGNITMGAAISENGVLTHIPIIRPYNTEFLVTFLYTLYRDLIPEQERGQIGDDLPKYVIVWDNVSFHRSNIIRQWSAAHNRMSSSHPTLHSLTPLRNFSQHGDEKYMIASHIHR